jgi:hypothetical protein
MDNSTPKKKGELTRRIFFFFQIHFACSLAVEVLNSVGLGVSGFFYKGKNVNFL